MKWLSNNFILLPFKYFLPNYVNTYVHHILVHSAEVKQTTACDYIPIFLNLKMLMMMITVRTYCCFIRADVFPLLTDNFT